MIIIEALHDLLLNWHFVCNDETIGNTVELGVRHLASFLYAPTSGPVNILHSREIHTHIGMPAHINTVLYSFGWEPSAMVDNEKLSLCCSEEGRYLLLWGRGVCGGAKRRERERGIIESRHIFGRQ